jgi:hypothetical protein
MVARREGGKERGGEGEREERERERMRTWDPNIPISSSRAHLQ